MLSLHVFLKKLSTRRRSGSRNFVKKFIRVFGGGQSFFGGGNFEGGRETGGGRNSHTKSGSIFGLDFGGHENTITNRGTGGGETSISNLV